MKNQIQNYDFKKGLAHEVEIVDVACLFQSSLKELTTPHRTEFYQLIWFKEGTPTHVVDFNPIEIKPNSILFLNKNIVQKFDPNTAFKAKALLFTDNFFCKSVEDTKYLRSSILFNDLLSVSRIELKQTSTIFSDLFSQMEVELNKPEDYFQPDILRGLLHILLLHAERERRKQNFTEVKKGANLDYVMLFIDLLEKQYKEQKLVNAYAQQMHVTEKRLNLATSEVLGKTPKEMIKDRVILEAKRLLAHSSESVKEIGFELGFDEPTNFIKYFRKHLNATPIEFRESLNL